MLGKKLVSPLKVSTSFALLVRAPPLRSANFPFGGVHRSSDGIAAHAQPLPAGTKYLPATDIDDTYRTAHEAALLASNEALRSLNEELIALNGELQETIKRQRTRVKSNVLAAVSHDLRQLLQCLALLQGLLEAKVKGPDAEALLRRLAQTLTTMSAMLNPMADMGQIEARIVTAEPINFIFGDGVEPVCVAFVEQAPRQKLRASQAMGRTQNMVPEIRAVAWAASDHGGPTIYIVDDDCDVRRSLCELLETDGRNVEDFGDCEAFLAAYRPGGEACLLIDANLPGIDGIELLRQLKLGGSHLPAIMITGSSAVPMAVEAMKMGAIDFIEKPVSATDLLASINRALLVSRDEAKLFDGQADASLQLRGLTTRQHQVMDLVLAGHPSKNIAADLGISQRTVENHRASIMKKTGAKSLPALARLALMAASSVA